MPESTSGASVSTMPPSDQLANEESPSGSTMTGWPASPYTSTSMAREKSLLCRVACVLFMPWSPYDGCSPGRVRSVSIMRHADAWAH